MQIGFLIMMPRMLSPMVTPFQGLFLCPDFLFSLSSWHTAFSLALE